MAALGRARPPHRWLLIGAARSGSALHVDPWRTAAWNTLVSGRKRWVVFHPACEAALLRADDGDDDAANDWFHFRYADARAAARARGYDFVQRAGETVYVPPGWPHAVVNLELSVAVTHNFVGPHNVVGARDALRATHPELAAEWDARMRRDAAIAPLYRRAIARAAAGAPLHRRAFARAAAAVPG